MPHLTSSARQITQGLAVIATLLLGTVGSEGVVQPVVPSQEPEKPMSCTVASASSENAAGHQEILLLDSPRVATSKRPPGPNIGSTPPVCPLHPAQEPSPPPVRP
jgi:hypothetical protein